ncbi:MAG: class IV adenylate cyclase [Nanoarchaeota archaeon]|nr:class IV adenylate cyclase [Nanoarchaeota archaeon]
MNIEVEAKIKLSKEEFDRLSDLLGEPDFVNQKNFIYNLPVGMVRIREIEGKRIVTYKGDIEGEKFKSLEEVEFETYSDLEKIRRFFNVLGFKETLVYEKKRADFNFENCVVSMDILGEDYYVEIEGKEEDIKRCLERLELENKKTEMRSYPEIVESKSQKS